MKLKPDSWFDEMNLRYLWRKLSSTVAKLSTAFSSFNDAIKEAEINTRKFSRAIKQREK